MDKMIPVNAAAKTVERLSSVNADIEAQILVLQETVKDNKEVIKSLDKAAKWEVAPIEKLPEEVIVGADPALLGKP